MTETAFDPGRTALLIVDLQNDFLHPEGAYARGGMENAHIAALPGRVKPVADALRAAGGWVISTQFTLVPGRGGEPMISPHLARVRSFLRRGDFETGGWGHRLVDTLMPADFHVEKIAYSAFYMTRLEWILRKVGVDTLIICGIVTNGGVASTVRAAHVRDLHAVVLTDGTAAFSAELYTRSIADLGGVADLMTCAEAEAAIARAG